MSLPSEGEYGLVMPFVVCRSYGGPFDDGAFVAGFELGYISGLLEHHPAVVERYVRTANMPQLDLIAMHYGYLLESEPWAEYPDEWTWVKLRTRVP